MANYRRNCSPEKDFDPLSNKSKQLCFFVDQAEYGNIVLEPEAFRRYLDREIALHPELFPAAIQQGYKMYDMLPASQKLAGIRLRRIELYTGDVFTIRPSFVLPYMTGYTDAVAGPLFLRRWGVPHWALAYVFGHDAQYWYRLENRLGRNSVVGTTVKDAAKLPKDLLADEKHTGFNGEKAYIATTVGNDCVLGASLTLGADEKSLTPYFCAKLAGDQMPPSTLTTEVE
jgi:hypothetical protein